MNNGYVLIYSKLDWSWLHGDFAQMQTKIENWFKDWPIFLIFSIRMILVFQCFCTIKDSKFGLVNSSGVNKTSIFV